MTYINILKLRKFDGDQLNTFGDIQQKPSGGEGGILIPQPKKAKHTIQVVFEETLSQGESENE